MLAPISDVLRRYRASYGLTQLEALQLAMDVSVSLPYHTLYSDDGHPIPRSSCLPRRDAL